MHYLMQSLQLAFKPPTLANCNFLKINDHNLFPFPSIQNIFIISAIQLYYLDMKKTHCLSNVGCHFVRLGVIHMGVGQLDQS